MILIIIINYHLESWSYRHINTQHQLINLLFIKHHINVKLFLNFKGKYF